MNTTTTQEAIIKVPPAEAFMVRNLMLMGPSQAPKDNAFDEEATFGDGNRMVIQVCPGGDGEPFWSQGVLFGPEGTELGCTEVNDVFFGEYRVDHDDVGYVCHVTPEGDIFSSNKVIEEKTITFPLAQQDEVLASVNWDEGWYTRGIGPMLIGPMQFSARLGELKIYRYRDDLWALA